MHSPTKVTRRQMQQSWKILNDVSSTYHKLKGPMKSLLESFAVTEVLATQPEEFFEDVVEPPPSAKRRRT